MKVGDMYVCSRAVRKYRVLRFEKNGINDVVLWSESFQKEELSVSALMIPENGWFKLPDRVTS